MFIALNVDFNIKRRFEFFAIPNEAHNETVTKQEVKQPLSVSVARLRYKNKSYVANIKNMYNT